jgi:RNA polymerase sigma factor (sigma-70 family)
MANGQLDHVLQHIRRLVAAESSGTRSDRELLERFVQHHDEAAFAALVQRHGPMVLSVCRRVLQNVHDAEDACQAAFLVLARKAASIRKKDSVGSWLHGVAYRAAARLKREVARRRAHEGPVVDVPREETTDLSWREVRTVLDEELRRLPERFQAPLLLCYLEGKTRDEAAQELGWSLGTLRGRLERGREMLRSRLTRRGLTLPAALLASLLTQQTVSAVLPATLTVNIVKSVTLVAAGQATATGIISARVVALMEGVLQAMWMTKLKLAAAVLLVMGLAGLGVGVLANGKPVGPGPSFLGLTPGEAAPAEAEEQRALDEPSAAGSKRERSIDPAQLARSQAESRLNLKKIALAMHYFESTYGHFPAPAIYSDQGEAGGGAPGMGRPGGMGGMPGMGPGGPGRLRGIGGRPFPGMMPGGPATGGGGSGMMPGGPAAGEGGPGAGVGTTPVIIGKDGKALLSWRVALLPYLDENDLYKQFRLDEPWDSPHNKKLLPRMPKVYAPPGITTREPYATFYQVFVGPHAAFEKHRGMRLADFLDGTSHTLLIVEAGHAAPWTKPEDLHFAADEPLPELGGLFPEIFNAAFADGSVLALSKKVDADLLRRAIGRDDGLVLDVNKLKAPTSRRESALRQQNERLKQEWDRERERIETLRREKEILQEMVQSAETERLEQENAKLEEALRNTREEVERLKEEIEHLKQTSTKRPEKPKKK